MSSKGRACAEAVVNDGWTFTLQPYTATRTWADVVAPLTEKVEAKVTLKLEHTPDA